MRSLVGFAAAITLLASGANAQSRMVLQPHSAWAINYDDDSCALQRQFGDEGRQAFLELREFGEPSRMVQITIASEDFKRRDGEFRFAIDPLEKETALVPGFNVRLDSSYEGKLFSHQIGSEDPRLNAALREFVSASDLLNDEQKKLVFQALDNLHNQNESRLSP